MVVLVTASLTAMLLYSAGVTSCDSSRYRTLLRLGTILCIVGGILAACGGGNQLTGESPNKITEEEIQEVGTVSNAYILVERLHPDWLQKRGTDSFTNQSTVGVYVEGSRRGGPNVLRQISVMNVKSIEHLSSSEATLRYGSGHPHGVVRVQLKSSTSR